MKRGGPSTLPLLQTKGSGSHHSLKKLDSAKGPRAINRQQEKMKDFIEDLNDHVKWLLNRKQFLLQGRHYQVLQQLNETKKALAVYEKGIQNLERQIEDDPKIKAMKSHIKFYEEYSSILNNICGGIDEEIRDEKAKAAEIRRILAEKKKSLNSKNHDNIQLASQITKLRDILQRIPGSNVTRPGRLQIEDGKNKNNILALSTNRLEDEENRETQDDAQRDPKDRIFHKSEANYEERERPGSNLANDYGALKKKTDSLIRTNNNLKKNIIIKISSYNEMCDLFTHSFQKYEDLLYKSQMIVHNQGLNGSLIFLLLNSKKRASDSTQLFSGGDNSLFGKKSHVKPFKKQQDGEVIDVIYSTFKKMLEQEDRKNDKVKEMVSSVQKDQLMTFTPMQIMGLILLKPEVLRDVVVEFEDKKKRLIGISMSLKGVKISEKR